MHYVLALTFTLSTQHEQQQKKDGSCAYAFNCYGFSIRPNAVNNAADAIFFVCVCV